MSVLDLSTRVQLGTQNIDFRKAFAWLASMLVKLIVLLIAAVPFTLAWSVTMVVKIAIAASQEGVRSASAQLSRGGGS